MPSFESVIRKLACACSAIDSGVVRQSSRSGDAPNSEFVKALDKSAWPGNNPGLGRPAVVVAYELGAFKAEVE
jgi:hypothetical protein